MNGWRQSNLRLASTLFLAFLIFCGCFASRSYADTDSISSSQISGPVKVKVTLEPKSPVIGDTIKLTIEVEAEKDVEVLMPDFGSALHRFAILDFAPRKTIGDQGRTFETQTYRLESPSSGPQVVPPILIEYIDRREGKQPSPEGLDAYEILTERVKFEVQSVLPSDTTAELKPPMGRLEPQVASGENGSALWWIAGAFIAMVLGVAAIVFWAKSKKQERRRSAFEIAIARLEELLLSPRETEPQVDQFYVQLTAIIRQYIEDRFEMRAPELTTEEFLASISNSPDISSAHQGLLRDFLRHADLVKFAGAKPSTSETARSIEIAKRFLEETKQGGDNVGH